MGRRSLLAAVVFSYCAAMPPPACFANLDVQLFPLTGEVRLLNRELTATPIVYYQITSAGGALDGANGVWTSISRTYDSPAGPTPGNGLVDPTGQWQILSASPTELTEGVFSAPGGSLPATRAISLGHIWNPTAVPFPDLVFDVRNDQGPIPVALHLSLDGDYSFNQSVDQADYVLWRRHLDSTTMLLADGNLNGVVDVADYLVWRANFGTQLPLPPYGAGSGGNARQALNVVPEPANIALALIACGCLAVFFRRPR